LVVVVPDGHAPPTVVDVAQVQTECLARAQAAVQHQAHRRQVTAHGEER
jgi:hypothetical protein